MINDFEGSLGNSTSPLAQNRQSEPFFSSLTECRFVRSTRFLPDADPLLDSFSIETPVTSHSEGWKIALVNQAINRGGVNP
jgi:hypothetical protein